MRALSERELKEKTEREEEETRIRSARTAVSHEVDEARAKSKVYIVKINVRAAPRRRRDRRHRA